MDVFKNEQILLYFNVNVYLSFKKSTFLLALYQYFWNVIAILFNKHAYYNLIELI